MSRQRRRERARERWLAELAPNGWEQEVEKVAPRLAREPRPLEARHAFTCPREAAAGSRRPATCEVCGSGGRIAFDHCHTTEKFRGWICTGCNSALGFAKDNPATLRALADYLERFKASLDKPAVPAERQKPQPLEPFRPEGLAPSGFNRRNRKQYAYLQQN